MLARFHSSRFVCKTSIKCPPLPRRLRHILGFSAKPQVFLTTIIIGIITFVNRIALSRRAGGFLGAVLLSNLLAQVLRIHLSIYRFRKLVSVGAKGIDSGIGIGENFLLNRPYRFLECVAVLGTCNIVHTIQLHQISVDHPIQLFLGECLNDVLANGLIQPLPGHLR